MMHRERERERELVCYAMSMQGLATMGQIESGFSLLERAEAKGLLSRFDNEGYPMFHNLLQACRFVGDVKGISRVQAAIDRLGLIALAPVATAVVQGSLRQYQNGNVGEGVVDARAAHVLSVAPDKQSCDLYGLERNALIRC